MLYMILTICVFSVAIFPLKGPWDIQKTLPIVDFDTYNPRYIKIGRISPTGIILQPTVILLKIYL